MENPNRVTRGSFLNTAATGAAASRVGAPHLMSGGERRPVPNDTINLAWFGCGARGRQVMRAFAEMQASSRGTYRTLS